NRSFARLLHNYRDSPSTGWAGGVTYNGVNPSLGLGFRGNAGLFLDNVYIPSSSDVIDVRAGITRYTVGNKLKAEGFDLASLGFARFPRFPHRGLQRRSLFSNFQSERGRVAERWWRGLYREQHLLRPADVYKGEGPSHSQRRLRRPRIPDERHAREQRRRLL